MRLVRPSVETELEIFPTDGPESVRVVFSLIEPSVTDETRKRLREIFS